MDHVNLVQGAGQLVPGVKARVLREDGSLAGFNEPGELVVKTNAVTMGYLHNESAYAPFRRHTSHFALTCSFRTKDAFLDGYILLNITSLFDAHCSSDG